MSGAIKKWANRQTAYFEPDIKPEEPRDDRGRLLSIHESPIAKRLIVLQTSKLFLFPSQLKSRKMSGFQFYTSYIKDRLRRVSFEKELRSARIGSDTVYPGWYGRLG